MRVLIYNKETEPAANIECDCGEEFWVDPCHEENLEMMYRPKRNKEMLTEVCPRCRKTNQDGHLIYPNLNP